MGRKIPSKKHRGVKDPLVQQARRLQSLKGKINAPPTDPDDQPIPKSLTRLFAFQQRGNKMNKSQERRSAAADGASQSSAGDNPVAQLKQLPGETGRGFSLRINSAVRALNDPLAEQSYPDDVESEDTIGQLMAEKRERRRRKRRAAGAGDAGGAGGAAGAGGAGGAAGARAPHRLAQKKQARREAAAEETAWRAR